MDLIICSTPYQIFTAINLKLANILEDSDLIIFNYFDNANKIAENIRKSNMFENVKVSNVKKNLNKCIRNRYLGFMWLSYYMIMKKRYTRKYGFDKKYDRILFSFSDPSLLVMGRYLSENRGYFRCIGYEDGTASYLKEIYIHKYTYRLLKIPRNIYINDMLYLYAPDLQLYPHKECISVKINIILNNKELINKVFNWKKEMKIKTDILYMDDLSHDNLNYKICNILIHNQLKMLVKLHPRRDKNIYEDIGIETYAYTNIPFEVCCMNKDDIDDMIIISDFSTSCFTPKTIFGAEPTLILLRKIRNGNGKLEENVEKFLGKFKNTYKNPNKIFVPESIQEFEAIIKEKQ